MQPGIEIDDTPIQHIPAFKEYRGFEGVAFSRTGILAVTAGYTGDILLFRPVANGSYEDRPYRTLQSGRYPFKYPHDASFSNSPGTELLAVVDRPGMLRIYQSDEAGEFGGEPIQNIWGPHTQLKYTDGIAFVPPGDEYIAACNGTTNTITFYRRTSVQPPRYHHTPEFVLTHESINLPDGMGFSSCGKWLVSANHSGHCYSIFRRRNKLLTRGNLRYEFATIVRDPQSSFPHSAAFSPGTLHLLGTNAGTNFFAAYPMRKTLFGARWASTPAARVTTDDLEYFLAANDHIGPKGIAVYQDKIAVCSPGFGIKIYRFRTTNA